MNKVLMSSDFKSFGLTIGEKFIEVKGALTTSIKLHSVLNIRSSDQYVITINELIAPDTLGLSDTLLSYNLDDITDFKVKLDRYSFILSGIDKIEFSQNLLANEPITVSITLVASEFLRVKNSD